MTITLTREEAQQVLDALECLNEGAVNAEIKLLRARLAQPEPEPVAWFSKRPDNKLAIKIVGKPTEGNWEPLYTDPPQREWHGLTDEEIEQIVDQHWEDLLMFAEVIEAKLKEKNSA